MLTGVRPTTSRCLKRSDAGAGASYATYRGRWSGSASQTAWRESRSLASICTSCAIGGTGGHVLDYALRDGTVQIDEAGELHVELPAVADAPDRDSVVDQAVLRRLEGT